jgi:hypothetical protein
MGGFKEQSAALKDGWASVHDRRTKRAPAPPPRQDDESADELAEQQGGPAVPRSTVDDQASIDGEVVGSNVVRLLPREADYTVRAAWTRQASSVKRFPPDDLFRPRAGRPRT